MEVKLDMDKRYPTPAEFKSAVDARCPRCRTGEMYDNPLLSLKKSTMHDRCPACDLKFEKEPGYFYVAMYVSYGLVVAELVAACIATAMFLPGGGDSPWPYIIVALLVTIILAPFNTRYSRVILLYWMTPSMRFDRKIFERVKQEGH